MKTAPTRPAASARELRWRRGPALFSPTWSSSSSIRPRSTSPLRPMPLVSEAVRGEGAILIDDAGRAFHGQCAARRTCAPRRRREGDLAGTRRGQTRLPRCALSDRRAFRRAFPDRRRGLPRWWRRSGPRADSRASGAALSHGRNRGGRRGAEFGGGPMGVRRGCMLRTARGQPTRQQFADRGGGVRRDSRPGRSRARPCVRRPGCASFRRPRLPIPPPCGGSFRAPPG